MRRALSRALSPARSRAQVDRVTPSRGPELRRPCGSGERAPVGAFAPKGRATTGNRTALGSHTRGVLVALSAINSDQSRALFTNVNIQLSPIPWRKATKGKRHPDYKQIISGEHRRQFKGITRLHRTPAGRCEGRAGLETRGVTIRNSDE